MDINKKDFMYVGLFLTDISKKKLEIAFRLNVKQGLKYFRRGLANWKMYNDHCTMIFNDGNFDDKKSETIFKFIESYVPGTEIEILIDGIGRYQNVFAFRVMKTVIVNEIVKNKQPHITFILDYNINRPVDSNKITEWTDIDPIKVKTVCKIVNKKK